VGPDERLELAVAGHIRTGIELDGLVLLPDRLVEQPLAYQPDPVDEILQVLPLLEVVEDRHRMVGGVGRAQGYRATAQRPGQVHPNLETRDRDQLVLDQPAGQRQELVLHVGEVDIVASAEESTRLKEVASSETPAEKHPFRADQRPLRNGQLGGEGVFERGAELYVDAGVVL
jgi:hypothetical protein